MALERVGMVAFIASACVSCSFNPAVHRQNYAEASDRTQILDAMLNRKTRVFRGEIVASEVGLACPRVGLVLMCRHAQRADWYQNPQRWGELAYAQWSLGNVGRNSNHAPFPAFSIPFAVRPCEA